MEMRSDSQSRLTAEIKLVPPWAWILAVAAFIGAQALIDFFAWQKNGLPFWVAVVVGIAAGVFLGFYVLLIGYISRDAKRRGMSVMIWTLVAIFVAHGLGIVLYFLLRQQARPGWELRRDKETV
jgi:hypothetical protein